MAHKIRYADPARSGEASPALRLFKILILVGVWTLVALAGFAAWIRFAA